jgi:hypothetical protein
MSQPNLTGTVSKVERLNATQAEITVDLSDPSIPADLAVEGSAPTLKVPMPLDRVKSFGLGCEVEITLKKKSAPRAAKSEEKVEVKDAAPADDGDAGDAEPTEEAKPAAAPTGRRRAAASSPTA